MFFRCIWPWYFSNVFSFKILSDYNPCYLDKKAKVQHRRMMKMHDTFVCNLNTCCRLPHIGKYNIVEKDVWQKKNTFLEF